VVFRKRKIYLQVFGTILATTLLGLAVSCASKPENTPNTSAKKSIPSATDTANAAKTFDSRIKTDPNDLDAKIGRAIVWRMEGKTDQAITLYLEVIKADPTKAAAHAGLGEILLDQKRTTEAKKAFETALAYDKINPEANAGLGRMLVVEGDSESAIPYLTKAISVQDDPWLRLDRARAFADEGQTQNAEIDFSVAIQGIPDEPFVYLDRGRARARANNPAGAKADFDTVLKMAPGYTLAKAYRAQVEDQLGQVAQALADYEAVLLERPDYQPAFEPLAGLYLESGKNQQASALLAKAYDPLRKNEYNLVFSAAVLLISADSSTRKTGETYAQTIIPKLTPDTILYQLARSYVDFHLEERTANAINKMPKGAERARAEVLLAAAYIRSGSEEAANRLAQDAKSMLKTESTEGRLTAMILHEQRNQSRTAP